MVQFQGQSNSVLVKIFWKKTRSLNCGNLPTLDMEKLSGRFINKYFDPDKPIKQSFVTDMFNKIECVKNKDKVRLAKLYLLSNFLIGKQISTGVEVDQINLLDDEEQFDNCPWCKLAYTTTIDSIKRKKKSNKKSRCCGCWDCEIPICHASLGIWVHSFVDWP